MNNNRIHYTYLANSNLLCCRLEGGQFVFSGENNITNGLTMLLEAAANLEIAVEHKEAGDNLVTLTYKWLWPEVPETAILVVKGIGDFPISAARSASRLLVSVDEKRVSFSIDSVIATDEQEKIHPRSDLYLQVDDEYHLVAAQYLHQTLVDELVCEHELHLIVSLTSNVSILVVYGDKQMHQWIPLPVHGTIRNLIFGHNQTLYLRESPVGKIITALSLVSVLVINGDIEVPDIAKKLYLLQQNNSNRGRG